MGTLAVYDSYSTMGIPMRYTETPLQSAAILRLVLPRIAHHGGHYQPTSYTVWYEHLAGVNPPLSEALEARLGGTDTLDPSLIEKLYTQHIRGRDIRNTEQLHAGLSELVRNLATVASTSGEGTAEYAKALAACEQELGSVTDPEGLQRLVRSLVNATASARATTETLRAEVDRTQQAMQKLQEQLGTLHGQALTDPLTGLRNRRGFDQAVAQLYGKRMQKLADAAILMADIDHFKQVNDRHGHLLGDQVLCACAEVLKGATKGRDIVTRFGGEEFLILLPDTPGSGALALAEQVRTALGKVRIRRKGGETELEPVTISIGVAVPAPGEPLEQAIDRADQALYQAKHDGRNCVRVASFGAAPAGAAARRSAAPR